MYALIQNDTITATGQPPRGARRLDTGQWVTPPADGWTPDLLTACGWQPVTEVPRPADTATTTSDHASVALVAGVPTQQWTVRPWTAEELFDQQRQTARADLTDTAKLQARLGRLAGYKTNTEIVAALARSNSTSIATADLNRLIKVMLRREERLSATIALLVRIIDPALLADVTDVTDTTD